MAATQLKEMDIRHHAILNWMLLNPGRSSRECADYFGVSQSWLSILTRSDVFQVELNKRQMQIASRICQTIPERLRMIADVSLDKLATKLEESEDPDFILEVADKTLARLGYGTGPRTAINLAAQQNVQQNFFVSEGDLAQAREVMGAQEAPLELPAPEDGELFLADQMVGAFMEGGQVELAGT